MVRLAGVMTCLEVKSLHRPNDKLTHKTKKYKRETNNLLLKKNITLGIILCVQCFFSVFLFVLQYLVDNTL